MEKTATATIKATFNDGSTKSVSKSETMRTTSMRDTEQQYGEGVVQSSFDIEPNTDFDKEINQDGKSITEYSVTLQAVWAPPSLSLSGHEYGNQVASTRSSPKSGDINAAKQKALQAAKNLEEYLLVHYTMLRDYAGVSQSDDRSQLSFDDIVHYHVYGDYRLLVSHIGATHRPR